MKRTFNTLIILALSLVVSFGQTITDIVVNSDDHNTLEAAVIAAGLDDDLAADGSFTLFAPTDAAFAALPAGTVETLLMDPTGELAQILLYHVAGLEAFSTDLTNGQMVMTLQGEDVTVTIDDDGVFINDATVTMANIDASNGVVHVIDAVLLPPPPPTVVEIIVNSDVHTTLEAAVIAAELDDDLSGEGPFTVFAPTDDAFAALPAGTVETLLMDPTGELAQILLYHVAGLEAFSTDLTNGQMVMTLQGEDVTVTIDDDGVFINDAMVTMADIDASNGVVHVIDAVLLPPPPPTVVEIIVNSDVHTTLEAAVIAAELDDDLSGEGPFTVFAPTDDAFAALPAGTVETLLMDPTGELAQILLYHVAGLEAFSTDLTNGQMVMTLQGEDVTVTIDDDGVFINDAMVTMADIDASNGVVHVIDAVLLPPTPPTVVEIIVNSDVHTTLEAAVIAAELDDDLSGEGPFTVFAPTDDAFAALPAGTVETLLMDPTGELAQILLYHVAGLEAFSTDLTNGQMVMTLQGEDVTVTIDDDGVFINDAMVTMADIDASNGVVHVIDAVLLPPTPPTVVEIIVNSDVHTTLEAAVIAAELDDDLSGEGPFTVFAPTDDAFAALPAGTVETLLMDPTGELAQILLYHVAGLEAFSTDLTNGQMVMTLQGEDVTVTIDDDGVFINDAMVTMADIDASNGVVHVIDAVLLPPTPPTVVEIIVNSDVHTTLEAAVIAAELDDDLSGEGPFTVFAPTDDAFAALPAGTVETLLMDPTGELAQILLYHVAGLEAFSTDLTNGQMVMTLQGEDVTVTIDDDGVFINDAMVTMADIDASNGVVHVIDAVLLPPTPPTVVEIIVNSDVHTTLEAAVIAAELDDDLSGEGPFTVFAPTDDAFAALPAGTVETLLMDPTGELAQILLYHVAGLEAFSTDLTNGQMVMTLQGEDVTVTIDDDGVFINDAMVTMADIDASNGVVHVIDAVLLPPTPPTVVEIIVNSDVHTTLEAAVIAAELDDDLSGEGPFTVFAPTDDAFAALPAGTVETLLMDPTGELAQILLYHVAGLEAFSTDLTNGQMVMTLQGEDVTVTIDDDGVFINDAMVTMADIDASNGVVHVIDAVLLPPTPPTVVEIIVNSDVHTTLEAAVIAAELDDDLSGEGPFTVFAPTDDAFAALPAGTVETLLEDPTGDLATILLYHVVGGNLFSTDLSNGQMAATLQGEDVTVTINDDGVFINDAMVTMADIEASNGVVHVIDAVLLPNAIVGLNPAFEGGITVSPNPASSFLEIQLPANLGGEKIFQVIDANGKLVTSQKTIDQYTKLDVSNLSAGFYFLRIDTVSGSYFDKIVIR